MCAQRILPSIENTHEATYGPIDTKQLVMYAGASGDFNRIHYDYPFVKKAGLENVLAHGMLSMAFMANCLREHVGQNALVLEFNARFLSPVYVGDTVVVVSTINKQVEDGNVVLTLVGSVGGNTVVKGKALVLPSDETIKSTGMNYD